MHLSPGIFILAMLLLSSCTIDNACLQGEWQAVDFFENGQKSNVDLAPVRLEFGPPGQYRFTSAGRYSEEGSYRISMQYIFFSDTTANPPKEHIVKVLFLSPDTLKLRMQLDSTEQVLFLVRPESTTQQTPG